MTAFFVVVENLSDWQPYYPSQDVITFDEYLEKNVATEGKRVRVINLCRSYRYLGVGYYCSLLAEARGHHVFPSVATINDLGRKDLASLQFDYAKEDLKKLAVGSGKGALTFHCWFGQTLDKGLSKLAQSLFEKFPCPLLEISLVNKRGWRVNYVKAISLKALSDPNEQEAFAVAFENFSRKMWRKPKAHKTYRFDLAVLVDPEEGMPPSDPKALNRAVPIRSSWRTCCAPTRYLRQNR